MSGRQSRFTQSINNPILKTVNSSSQLLEFPTSTDRHLDVNIASTDSGHGLATAANQETVINASVRDINNTGAIGDGSSQHSTMCLGYDRTNGQGRSILVDASGKVETNVSMNTGHGLATAANQETVINASLRAINNTGAIGDGSTNATVVALGYDRSNGQGRSLLVDSDGHLQCDVVSGAITETNSADILADTTSIDGKITACNTGAVVVASGAITETNSAAILSDTASLDTKITACNTGAVVVASGAITETNSTAILSDTASLDSKITACNTGAVVVASGAITETNSAAILADTASLDGKITACNTGAVVVASGAITETNSTAILADTASLDAKVVTSAPVSSNGTTSAQTVNIMGSADGTNFRTVKTGTGGELITEVDHTWDITNVLINNVTVAAGVQQLSSEFDLGQGVSHEIGRIEVFVDNSAGVSLQVIGAARHTSSGTEYFPHDAPSVTSTEESFTFSQDDVGLSLGHRFMLFQVENKDASTSTDVTLRVAYYK